LGVKKLLQEKSFAFEILTYQEYAKKDSALIRISLNDANFIKKR
jgi:hypothetical protein